MLRLVSLPFSLFLLVLSVGLVAAGLSLVADATGGGDNTQGDVSFLDIDIGGDHDSSSGRDDGATVAGVSMIGFGILGAIAAVALLVAALSGGKDGEPVPVQAPAQQQQQQVVVVTDGEARVETGQGR